MRIPANESDTDKLTRRNRELSILNAIAEALNREVDLTESLRTTLGQVAELVGLRTGWVWLTNEDTGAPYLAVTQNLPPALTDAPELMDGSAYCYCLDKYKHGLLDPANVSIITCTRLKGLVEGTEGLKCHASIPLYAHGKPLGVLNVASHDWEELTPDELRLMYTIGDLLSIAVERARLFGRSAEAGAIEERNRLAREIHDTLAQSLAGIALQLETAEAVLDDGADLDRARQMVHQALWTTRNSLEEARRSVLDLRAAPLEGRSLSEAIRALAESHAERGGLRLAFTAGEERPLPRRVEAALYRIAQEALANVVRHAKAERVDVTLMTTPDRVELCIEDDGIGFDPETTSQDRFGLIGLNERVRLLGGTLGLCSEPGDGTRLEVTIPLEETS